MSAPQESQVNINLGALAERVAGTERNINALGEQLGRLQQDTSAQFSNLASSVSAQMHEVSAKIDAQANNYASSRATNWTAFFSTAAAVGAFILTLGGMAIWPITTNLNAVTIDLKDISKAALQKEDFRAYAQETSGWISNLRDRLRADEDGSVSQRQFAEFRERVDERSHTASEEAKAEHSRLERRIDELSAVAATKAEVSDDTRRTDERFTALNGYLGELRHDYATAFSTALKEKPNAPGP
jgi:chromosome segregation ATPase